jgi:hypothetical protein
MSAESSQPDQRFSFAFQTGIVGRDAHRGQVANMDGHSGQLHVQFAHVSGNHDSNIVRDVLFDRLLTVVGSIKRFIDLPTRYRRLVIKLEGGWIVKVRLHFRVGRKVRFNGRRQHQIPAHKRERSSVAELHEITRTTSGRRRSKIGPGPCGSHWRNSVQVISAMT